MSTPPPPPQSGSPYGGTPYGGTPQAHPQGTTILVLGILGLLICGPLGVAAWVMGNNAIAEIDRNPAGYSNRGQVQAGRICGMIATALWVIGILIVILTSL